MHSAELRRRLKKLGRQRGVVVRFDASHGKGSHGRLFFGYRAVTIPTHGELKSGTLHGILKALGLTERDL
jgi:predicted RNA binding protein YcfA (HicA-like mRNA interferase family)